ncbi:MAG: hypothetical protein QNK37_22230 [Acidobacteriota bacterium]|nr:hypothetical protein [Acidobacteriota bacterium]
MRKIVVFFLALITTVHGLSQTPCSNPPTIAAGQVFNVSTDASLTASFGTVYDAVGADEADSFFLTSTQVGGMEIDPYFTIRTNGELRPIKNLWELFSRQTVNVDLTVFAVNACGASAPTLVTVRVTDAPQGSFSVPIVSPGQVFQVAADALTTAVVAVVFAFTADGTPVQNYNIIASNPDLALFRIDSGGAVRVTTDLANVAYADPDANPQTVVLTVTALNESGVSAPVDVTMEINMPRPPVVTAGQRRAISTNYPAFEAIDPVIAIRGSLTPTPQTAVSVIDASPDWADGVFAVNSDRRLETTVALDSLIPLFPNNDPYQTVELTVQAFNDFGLGPTETLYVDIRVADSQRCPRIIPDQTAFVSRLANVGDEVAEVTANQNVTNFWIDRVSTDLNGPTQYLPSTLFNVDNLNGRITVARPLADPIFSGLISATDVTPLRITLAGTSAQPAVDCPALTMADFYIYVVPGDAVVPQVIPGQIRYINSTLAGGGAVGEQLLSGLPLTVPPSVILGWDIITGNDGNLFRIDSTGQLFVLNDLTGLDYTTGGGEIDVILGVVVYNDNGPSRVEDVTIRIVEIDTGDGGGGGGGGQAGQTGQIIAASNTTPIVITSPGHGLLTGSTVSIIGVSSPSNANGVHTITVENENEFSLDETNGNGDFVFNPSASWILLSSSGTTEQNFAQLITDSTLRTCILETVGALDSGFLGEALVQGLRTLDCSCRSGGGINNLQGLRFFTNLEFLALQNNLIEDITPITGLRNLVDLKLAGNLITDITTFNPFASLTSLERLDLSDNQISDTYAFNAAASLAWLSLANNDICDISSLVDLADIGALSTGDFVDLSGNHLFSQAGQQQISILESAGVTVRDEDNDSVSCNPLRNVKTLGTWPENTDVRDLAGVVNIRGSACGDQTP